MSDEQREFLCEWRIEVTASSPREAALQAEQLMTLRRQSCWTITDEVGDQTNIEITDVTS